MNGSREREEAIDRMLRRSRAAAADAGAAGSCVDAETLAAWADGGLSGATLEMVQLHVADCTRCQALVGALAQIDRTVPAATSARAGRAWFGWLVPVAAAAAAVVIWVIVPSEKNPPSLPTAELRKQAEVTETDQRREAAQRGEGTLSRDGGTKTDNSVRRDAPAGNAVGEQTSESRADVQLKDESLQQKPEQFSAAAPAPPASAPAAPDVPASTASAEPAAAAATAARTLGAAQPAERLRDVAGIEIVSPDPSVRWRIVGSAVQHSVDGGSRWENVPTGTDAALAAGAAPSASVCWLVGRGGTVLLWADGPNWRRVAFPESTDLSAVRAIDARTATVRTADGRVLSTTDGGASWVRRPPQEF